MLHSNKMSPFSELEYISLELVMIQGKPLFSQLCEEQLIFFYDAFKNYIGTIKPV